MPASPTLTVGSTWTLNLLERAPLSETRRRGILRSLGLVPELQILDRQVARRAVPALWATLSESQGSHFGLAFGAELGQQSLGALGALTASCSTLGTALEKFVRFYPLVLCFGQIRLSLTDHTAIFSCEPHAGEPPWPRHLSEAMLSAFFATARQTHGADFRALEVHFQHRAPTGALGHSDHFDCAVRFERASNQIVFDREMLGLRRVIDPALCWPGCEAVVRSQLDMLASYHELSGRISGAIRGQMQLGEPTVARTARMLAMSTRTLQRRLKERDMRFRDVLDNVRRDIALAALHENDAPVTEISFSLGFSEPRAFRRAFRRWTGSSPVEYRRLRRLG